MSKVDPTRLACSSSENGEEHEMTSPTGTQSLKAVNDSLISFPS